MAFLPQIKIPATYMRGGTSKGVFFKLTDLASPTACRKKQRDDFTHMLAIRSRRRPLQN